MWLSLKVFGEPTILRIGAGHSISSTLDPGIARARRVGFSPPSRLVVGAGYIPPYSMRDESVRGQRRNRLRRAFKPRSTLLVSRPKVLSKLSFAAASVGAVVRPTRSAICPTNVQSSVATSSRKSGDASYLDFAQSQQYCGRCRLCLQFPAHQTLHGTKRQGTWEGSPPWMLAGVGIRFV